MQSSLACNAIIALVPQVFHFSYESFIGLLGDGRLNFLIDDIHNSPIVAGRHYGCFRPRPGRAGS